MWPVAYAINELASKEEKQIIDLIKRAIG